MGLPAAGPLQRAAPWWRPAVGQSVRIRGGRPLHGNYALGGAKNFVVIMPDADFDRAIDAI